MEINNLKTNFLDLGEGSPIVLLHGWGGTSLSMLGLANELSTKFRVIVPDLWGFGGSQPPNENSNIFNYASLTKDLLNALNLEKVVVVGHSLGGRIALILASTYHELVEKLVLIDSAGLKPKFSIIKYWKIKRYKRVKQKVENGTMPAYKLQNYGSADYKELSEPLKSIFVRVVNQDLSNLLDKIETKTLILWGKKDKDTPRYMAKLLHKNIKCSKLLWLDGGHFAYMTQQKKVVQHIFEFLEEN